MYTITLAHTASTDLKRGTKKSFSSIQIEDPVQNLTNVERSEIDLRPFKSAQNRLRLSAVSLRVEISKNLAIYEDLLKVEKISKYENLEDYTDNYPLLSLRKAVQRINFSVSSLCESLTSSLIFETFIILVILMNTVVLAIQDPRDSSESSAISSLDKFFMYTYTVECGLKIISKGLIAEKSGYLRDYWNLLDLTIVVSSWLDYYLDGIRLNSLRTLRILRPLRGISSIKGLKWIFQSLMLSAVPLVHSLIVLTAFIFLFSVAGLQLWVGVFKYQCLDIHSGVLYGTCGSSACDNGSKCADSLQNPFNNTLSFDNLLVSMVYVFQIITLEGWSGIMELTQITFGYASFIYFLPLVFIGTYIILNLSTAIIAHKFSEVIKIQKNEKSVKFERETKLEEFIKANEDSGISLKDAVERDTLGNGIAGFNERCASLADQANPDKNLMPGLNSEANLRENNLTRNMSLVIHTVSKSIATELQWRYSSQYIEYMNSEIRNSEKIKIADLTKASSKVLKIKVKPGKLSFDSQNDVLDDNDISIHQSFCFNFQFLSTIHLALQEKYSVSDNFQLFSLISKFSAKSSAFIKIMPKVKIFFSLLQDEALSFECSLSSVQHICQDSRSEVKEAWFESYKLFKNFENFRTVQQQLKRLMNSVFVSSLITLLVIVNVICLSLDYYGASSESLLVLRGFNTFFTFFFLSEMALKLVSEGPVNYCRSSLNILDSAVVVLNLVEFFILSGRSGTFNAFRVLRIIRIFRILRVLKMFRYLSGIVDLISIISSSITEFLYLFCLILLFIVIFSLLGMEIFALNFEFPEGRPRSHFDKFHNAFITIFQVLSLENWDSVLISALRYNPVSSIFLIVWIIIGNFVLLNVFLAILLQGFQNFEKVASYDERIKKNSITNRLFKTVSSRINEKRMKEIEARYIVEEDEENGDEEISDISDLEKIFHKKTRVVQKNFEGIMCEKSFYLFSKENRFRIALYKVTVSNGFEFAILVIILMNSVKLVFDTYILESDEKSAEVKFSTVTDTIFTTIFGLEILLKSISNGLLKDEGSYLSDLWNILDFSIVILSIVDLALSSIDIPVIKIFRLLRTLRPLRFITHNLTMKIVVIALFSSIFAIINVLGIMALIFLIFAILGVSIFGGKLYECSNFIYRSQDDCIKHGCSWVSLFYNFDNVLESLSTLFTISSLESWPDRMYEGVDAVDVGHGLVQDYNPLAAYFYILVVVVGNFFMVSVFTAVVYDRFNRARQTENTTLSFLLTKNQLSWLEIQKLIIKSKPETSSRSGNANFLLAKLGPVVNSQAFESCIIIFIVLNTVSMAMVYDGASDEYLRVLYLINEVCTYIFIAEAFLKTLALGKSYFKVSWNQLDFFVAVCSVANIIIEKSANSNISLLRVAPQLIRIIRVLRISKIFKVFKFLKSIQTLVNIILFSLPAMLNVLSLMLLIFFIYAILGSFLFYSVKSGTIINEYFNFSNFHSSMILLWRISTGESYTYIMIDIVKHFNTKTYILYFYSFITLTTYIFLDLFVSVIVENYNEYYKNEESTVYLFNKVVKKFNKTWNTITNKHSGIKLPYRELPDLLIRLGPDLGVDKNLQHKTVLKIIASLDLELDPYGYVYYNDMLYSIMKRKYGRKLFAQGSQELAKKYLRKEEILAYKQLQKMRIRKMREYSGRSSIKEAKINKIRAFIGPIEVRPVFDAWKKFVKMRFGERRGHRNSILGEIQEDAE